MKRICVLALAVIGLTLAVPATGSASGWFNYWRNNSLVSGTFSYNCSNAGCGTASLRAGSGSGKNACEKNHWIPVGTYTVPWHQDNYAGSLIRGRVWRLSDYQCSNGVRRTELFVHSEETSSQGQADCGLNGDGPFCWEGPNDYYSFGCIKIARQPVTNGLSDLGRADRWVHQNQAVTSVRVYA